MPTYDYKCLDCGHTFEYFQRITEEQLTNCPVCNGHVKRLIGAGSTPIFRGSGFYQTDYKNNSKKSNSNSSEKKNDSATSEKKSDSSGTEKK
ncbi:FmdB family transcriptional regulator [bacterium]|nr:FmdB family transcriptional regulator [bacterium]